MNFKAIRKNPVDNLKRLAYKFVRSILMLLFAVLLPYSTCCVASNLKLLTRRSNKIVSLLSFSIASLCFLWEPPSRHEQYVGFLVPRIAQIYFSVAKKRLTQTKDSWLRSVIQVFLFCGLVGIAHSRGHYKKEKDSKQDDVKFTSVFSPLWE